MYTVKTIRSSSGGTPQISINYQDSVQQTDQCIVPADTSTLNTNTDFDAHLDINKSPTILDNQPTDTSDVSLLHNISLVEKLDELQGRESAAASVFSYDNAAHTFSTNSQQTLTSACTNVDNNILTFSNITYCATQNSDPIPSMQKIVILPLSEQSAYDNTDCNTELQTAVANIRRSPVYNEPQDKVYVQNREQAMPFTVHISSCEEQQETSINDVAVTNYNLESDKQLYELSLSATKTKDKQPAPRLQKFTRTDLGYLGTSEKELFEYLEKSKNRRARRSTIQNIITDPSKTETESTVGYESHEPIDSSQTKESIGKYPYSKSNAKKILVKHMDREVKIGENLLKTECNEVASANENHSLLQSYSAQTIRSKGMDRAANISKAETEEPTEEPTDTAKAPGAREIPSSQSLSCVNDQNKKTLSTNKKSIKKAYYTRNKSLSRPADQSGPDIECRSDHHLFTRTFNDDNKCVISLPTLTIQSFKDTCTEYVVEIEIEESLDISKLSKSESSSGTCKYSFSVKKPVPLKKEQHRNAANLKNIESNTECETKAQLLKSETKVRKRKSQSEVRLSARTPGKKTKKSLQKKCDKTYSDRVPKHQPLSSHHKIVVKGENIYREEDNINDDDNENYNEMISDTLEATHTDTTNKATDIDNNTHIDPLIQLTASLAFDINDSIAHSKISEEKLGTETVVDTIYNGSKVEDQKVPQPPEKQNTDILPCIETSVSKKKKERNYITRIGEDGIKVFGCPICSHTSKYSQNMLIHIAEHSDEKNFVCEECGIQFKSKNRLSKHMVVHTTDRPYTCPLCPKAFKGKKIFCCKFCPHETRKGQNMSVHMNQHTDDRPYQCEVCGQTFKGPSNLSAHKTQHSDVFKYTCVHCNKGFRDRATYRQHTRRHAGDKRHTCEHCGKSFVVSTDLKKHIRVHTGEKPYKCGICGKAFSDGSGMVRHQRIHTTKSRFECGACYKLFTRKDLCNYHIKKFHGDVGPVKVREINMSDISKTIDGNNSIKKTGNNDKTAVDLQSSEQKYLSLKKSWPDFERLTEEASRRLQDGTSVQTYVQGPAPQTGEYPYLGIVPPVQHFHTLSSAAREYNHHANFFQQQNQDISLFTQEPIQNL